MQRNNKGNNTAGNTQQSKAPEQKAPNVVKPAARPPGGILQDQKNRSVLIKLLYFTFMMFTLPFLAYYIGSRLDSYIPIDISQHRTIWGAGTAVVTVNLVIAAYIVAALKEKDD